MFKLQGGPNITSKCIDITGFW